MAYSHCGEEESRSSSPPLFLLRKRKRCTARGAQYTGANSRVGFMARSSAAAVRVRGDKLATGREVAQVLAGLGQSRTRRE